MRRTLAVTGALLVLVGVAGLAPAAAGAAPPFPDPPVVTSAGSGLLGGASGAVPAVNGSRGVQLYTSSGSTCSKQTGGPGVRKLSPTDATPTAGGDNRFFLKPPNGLVAGDWVYGQAFEGDHWSDVGPCTQVHEATAGDGFVSATTPTTATLTWAPVAGATGYTVRVMRRSGFVLRTIEADASATSLTVTDLGTAALYRFHIEALTANGPGRAAWTPSMTPLPFTTIDALATQQFRDVTGRDASTSERAAWFADLYDGKPTVPGKIAELIDSPGWSGVQSPVIRLFRASFGRWPDAAGLAYWADRRRHGTTLRMTATVMTSSTEFRNRYGSLANGPFVKRIYLNVLGRSADSSGLAYWTNRLDHGLRRGDLVVLFSEGSEHVRKTAAPVGTVNITTAMLRRVPTSSELSTWGGLTPPPTTDLIATILGSPAYGARITP
ncbi:MAG: hypothetical protein JWO77_612 [Ilumatobacteraceae bacterium]|nr:hypothetical protein [Ilumatobacteraceae bacterium]